MGRQQGRHSTTTMMGNAGAGTFTDFIQVLAKAGFSGLQPSVEVGELFSSLCPKAPQLQAISICGAVCRSCLLTVTTTLRSLRKNRLTSCVFPSGKLIALRSGWFSLFQPFRRSDFRRFAPFGLPGASVWPHLWATTCSCRRP